MLKEGFLEVVMLESSLEGPGAVGRKGRVWERRVILSVEGTTCAEVRRSEEARHGHSKSGMYTKRQGHGPPAHMEDC